MGFRFLHTADIHLDSPLKTLALRDAELGAHIRGATRRAFAGIVDICLEQQLDALVIAGDLYDRDIHDMSTALFFGRQMRRLAEAGIRVFIIRGNHDAESVLSRELSLPENVLVFGAEGGTERLQDAGVAIHGVSFASASVPENLLNRYPAPVPGLINIGLLHTSLTGAEGHDVYAPCTLADLRGHGFDYWALGHVHKRAVHAEAPWIVMPGIPQGRDIGEDGPKSATLVTVGDDGAISVEAVPTAVAQFEHVPADLSGAETMADAAGAMERALAEARKSLAAPCLIARLTLTGDTPLAARLRRDDDLTLNEARQAAESVGDTLIDRVKFAFGGARQAESGPLAELEALMTPDNLPPEVVDQTLAAVDTVRRALPAEARKSLPDDEDARRALADQLIAEGGSDVIARLHGAEET
ncbi:metallophosphoesterase family protein [Dichotomicrobium thermohalophilum]|uniref:DNA repair exonuclease SbcCD nuclease subunit n=1 Tax=Dichotomicrobium thermohalophilum TaxID=933063 RepID=A0A397Q3D3_9HYPH|nr:DNA repair exonuclease [Dichotomicrobium thermohalophilum]RIA55433.1 DNA repair exonuclease SbcCD nuclease subunit [Dichotomicrobium thermohalophilum]